MSKLLEPLLSSGLWQDKLKRAELELEEERSSLEIMTDRMSRSRDQIDQLRSELMQERSSKQDLELDKNAMERQVRTCEHTPDLWDFYNVKFSAFFLETAELPLQCALGSFDP